MIREIRTIALLMAIIIVCLALGTLNAPQRDLSAKQEEHQKRFGAVYMTLNNPFYEIIDEEIRTEVEKHGDVLLSRDPALSVEKQTEEIEDLIREGYLTEAVLNYVALLGWSPKGENAEREFYTLAELAEIFDISGISKSRADVSILI